MIPRLTLFACCLIATVFAMQSTYAADIDTSKVDQGILAEARALIENEDYNTAKSLLNTANAKTPGNADILNLLGFVCRKAEQLGDAAQHYAQALEIDPDHKGALEYQGELYLLLERPEKAKANLRRLAEICAKKCEEYEDLAEAIAAYVATH